MRSSEAIRLDDAHARIGTLLRGKWRLDSLLGVGGMSAVYAATHRNGTRCALKLLDELHARMPSTRERFLREGYASNLVDHPGAVRVLDDDDGGDCVFLVMELLSGQTLEALAHARGGKLPVEEVLIATARVLEVLEAAHARSIIHRDIKPENVFVTDRGAVKVLDFGLARVLDRPGGKTATRPGIALGTPGYMSPEQARGRAEQVDPRSDLYSVGASMFTLISGELVHGQQTTVAEMMAATFGTQARSLLEVAPSAPPSVVALVDRALRLERGERWPSAKAMHLAVSHVYLALYGEPLPPAVDAPAPPVLVKPQPSSDDLSPRVPNAASSSMTAVTTPPPASAITRALRSGSHAIGSRVLYAGLGAAAAIVLVLAVAARTSRSGPSAAESRTLRALHSSVKLSHDAELAAGKAAVPVSLPASSSSAPPTPTVSAAPKVPPRPVAPRPAKAGAPQAPYPVVDRRRH